MSKYVVFKGIDATIKKIRKQGKEYEKIVEFETRDAAKGIELQAKTLVPVDTGALRQSIYSVKLGQFTYEIGAGGYKAPYAPYIEFGTGGLVVVPEEWKAMAWQFKGKGIRKVNRRPQPYLYPAFDLGRKLYIQTLKKLIK